MASWREGGLTGGCEDVEAMLSIAADNYGKNREKQEQRTERKRVTIDPEIVFEQQQRNTGGICD